MNAFDVIVLLLVCAGLIVAVVSAVRSRKKKGGGCGCGCGSPDCSACKKRKK